MFTKAHGTVVLCLLVCVRKIHLELGPEILSSDFHFYDRKEALTLATRNKSLIEYKGQNSRSCQVQKSSSDHHLSVKLLHPIILGLSILPDCFPGWIATLPLLIFIKEIPS